MVTYIAEDVITLTYTFFGSQTNETVSIFEYAMYTIRRLENIFYTSHLSEPEMIGNQMYECFMHDSTDLVFTKRAFRFF